MKLIDTSTELSLQLHPGDDFSGLNPLECGKPESWLIQDAEPGAGIYLGFRESMTSEELRARLTGGLPMTREDLHFVPVHKYDYFEIEPGTPHAIGAGVTLIEPQRCLPGKMGVTYRMWDWERRYDQNGLLDQDSESLVNFISKKASPFVILL